MPNLNFEFNFDVKLVLPFVSLLAVACGDDPIEPSEQVRQLEESRVELDEKVTEAEGDYSYSRKLVSFSGAWERTTIDVAGGVVVARTYASALEPVEEPDVYWSETGADIGSHAEGFPAVTLDALYDECATDVLTRDPVANTIVLSFDDGGLLDACTYTPVGCVDDCTQGIDLEQIDFVLPCGSETDCG